MASSFITALDIGTATIRVAVAENVRGKPVLRLVHREESRGVRKGAIADVTEASHAVSRVLAEVRKAAKPALKNLYCAIGTPQAKVQTSRGIVAVSRADTEIYQDDVERVIKAAQAVNLLPNRTIVHNVTREFIVDGVGDIADPLGLSGSRLEVVSFVIDVFAPHVKNLMRVVELAGGRISGLVWAPLVSSRAALSRAQKELGTVLIDVGAGTTGMTVYEENKLIGLAKFPVGSGNVSNDLAVGLRVPVDAAEELKLSYGYACAREVSGKEIIELRKFAPEAKGTTSRRYVAEIIESRLAEILEFAQEELKAIGRAGKLPGGAVLVGGGAKIPGFTELVKQELKLSAQVGGTSPGAFAPGSGEFSGYFEDPEFATVLGLVLWGAEEAEWEARRSLKNFKFELKSIKDLFRYFLP
ncbi:MAG: cell division protein FtsA [Candidatus Liptonbacteria bacterium]|nr:cell division protein FtsA [Candidatus Liptonbacteria bacterium]